jgi:hypothetical protein
MVAGKRTKTGRTPDKDTPDRREAAPTGRSWKIVTACAALLTIYLWLHADAVRLLLGGFASR